MVSAVSRAVALTFVCAMCLAGNASAFGLPWLPPLKLPGTPIANVAKAVVAQVKNTVYTLGQDVAPEAATSQRLVQYLLGTAPNGSLGASPAQIAAGNAPVILDPNYWTYKFNSLLTSGSFTLPWPADLIKPELVLPSATIANDGGAHPWVLPTAPQDLSGIKYSWNGQTYTVADFLRNTETDGLVFLHNGALVGDYYANGYSEGQAHQPWSATKSFISAMVGIAYGEGRIASLQDPIEKYIAELRGTAWEGTTIQNLLQMQSGIHWDEGTPNLPQNTQVQEWAQVWLDYTSNGSFGQDRDAFLASLPRDVPQGTKFSYNSGNTQVLAWMLENIYGDTFTNLLSRKLWQPMGMSANASMITDRTGHAIASQGLYAVPLDFARFGQLYENGGRTPDGRSIVPASWVDASHQFTSLSGGAYGLQWWSTADGFGAEGMEGNAIDVSPANCTVGVRLTHSFGVTVNSAGASVNFEGDQFSAMLAAVEKVIGGCG